MEFFRVLEESGEVSKSFSSKSSYFCAVLAGIIVSYDVKCDCSGCTYHPRLLVLRSSRRTRYGGTSNINRFCGIYVFSVHALHSVAQVAPVFEPVSPGSTYTVYVNEDTQSGESLFPVYLVLQYH